MAFTLGLVKNNSLKTTRICLKLPRIKRKMSRILSRKKMCCRMISISIVRGGFWLISLILITRVSFWKRLWVGLCLRMRLKRAFMKKELKGWIRLWRELIFRLFLGSLLMEELMSLFTFLFRSRRVCKGLWEGELISRLISVILLVFLGFFVYLLVFFVRIPYEWEFTSCWCCAFGGKTWIN